MYDKSENIVDFSLEENGNDFLLKLQGGDFWELNVRLVRDEINLLTEISNTNWVERKTIKAGISANSSVFWTNENDATVIMVGHDEETWDFAVCVPVTLIDKIVIATNS